MKKVLIGGVYYGEHNIGDEGLLFSIIRSFSSDAQVDVMTHGSEWIEKEFPKVNRYPIRLNYTKPSFGLYTIPRSKVIGNAAKIRKEIDFYRQYDLYICGGATILSDCPYYSLRTALLAEKAGTPVILWGVGMAEIADDKTKQFIVKVLNRKGIKKVFVRDEYVQKRLLELGIEQDKVQVSYDPAIILEGETFELSQFMNEESIRWYNESECNMVVSISGESDIASQTPISQIANEIIAVKQKYNANIILIPTGCGRQCKDTEMLKTLGGMIGDENVTVIEKEFQPQELVTFLKKVKLVVSSRLHMNIFAACAGVPSIGLVRNLKIVDFASKFKLPYVYFNNMTDGAISEKAEEVMKDYSHVVSEMASTRESMRRQYAASTELAKKILNQ